MLQIHVGSGINLPFFDYTKVKNFHEQDYGYIPERIRMKKKKQRLSVEEQTLLLEIHLAKRSLLTALSNLENLTDPDLIDCSIYELNAAQTRYQYLLHQAKSLGVTCRNEATYLAAASNE